MLWRNGRERGRRGKRLGSRGIYIFSKKSYLEGDPILQTNNNNDDAMLHKSEPAYARPSRRVGALTALYVPVPVWYLYCSSFVLLTRNLKKK